MATLTETAYYTRKGVKIFIGAVIGIIVLRVLLNIGGQIWLTLFPPPPPPATEAFGLLPKIKFPPTEISSTSGRSTYTLETVDGGLPKFPQNLRVYFIPKISSSFGKDEKMTAQASRLGFTDKPTQIFGAVDGWRFNDAALPLRHLDYDATLGTFRLYYDYRFDLNLFSGKNFSTKEQIIADATGFFSNLGLLPADLIGGTQTVAYFQLATNNLVLATSLSEADAVLVSFYRADIIIDKVSYPVLPPEANKSLVSVLFSGSTEKNKKILEAKYLYQTVDYENFATYPSVVPATAYDMLKRGQAYVISLPAGNPKSITIRQVYLGYYDAPEPQSYLQPVVVFSDGKGFEALVPAVSATLFAP